jgi:hypothetical protein
VTKSAALLEHEANCQRCRAGHYCRKAQELVQNGGELFPREAVSDLPKRTIRRYRKRVTP